MLMRFSEFISSKGRINYDDVNQLTTQDGLRIKMAGFIQYDDNMLISNNKGVPIVLKLGTYIEKNFTKIVKRIVS